jgi:hypothetical protein
MPRMRGKQAVQKNIGRNNHQKFSKFVKEVNLHILEVL